MKLESLQSYRKDAISMRIVMLIAIGMSLASVLYIYIDSRNFIAQQSNKKVVIDKENHAWLATEKIFTRDDRKIQYEEHIKDFYRLFFGFDAGTVQQNLNRALLLMEGTAGKNLYIKLYVEGELRREVIENNWRLEVEIEKVECNVNVSPAIGVIYARQILIRPSGNVVRHMNANFKITDARVSYDNPRGALITALDIFDNSRIDIKNKDEN